MTFGDLSASTPEPRNRAERRAAASRRSRKGMAVATGASVVASGLGLVVASPALGAVTCDTTVSSTADAGDGSLRAAIEAANLEAGPETICLTGSGTLTLASALPQITDTVAIVGPGADQLTISGDDTHQIFYVGGDPGEAATTISGLTLTRGLSSSYGGAVYARGQDTILEDLVFTENHSGSGGGAVAFRPTSDHTATYTLRRSTLTGNTSDSEGGALYVDGVGAPDHVVLDHVQITGNTAYSEGGGVYISGVIGVAIANSEIARNTAGYGGGGVAFHLYDDGAAVAITGTTITGNTAAYGGGGLYAEIDAQGTFSLSGSTISDNTAGGNGGGLYARSSHSESLLAVENTTMVGNTAGGSGGAVYTDRVDVQVRLSTITGNIAGDAGGGLLAKSWTQWSSAPFGTSGTGAGVELESSIVSGNEADGIGNDLATYDHVTQKYRYETSNTHALEPATISAAFSLVGAFDEENESITVVAEDGNLVGVDPKLGALAANGGTTLTRLPQSGSPVIDAGNSTIVSPPALDQRGLTRVVTRVDMGAVEVQPPPPPVVFSPPPTSTPPTTAAPRPSTPPTTAPPSTPPTTPPSQPQSPPVLSGPAQQTPRPPSAPPQVSLILVAFSPTESLGVTPGGQVFVTNPAHNFGQIPTSTRLNAPIIGVGLHYTFVPASTSSGLHAASAGEWVPSGYWMLGADGGVFSFGSAKFHGSTGAKKLNKPVVSIAPTPTGNGYWLVAADGGVFSFGDARFFGSTGAIKLNKPVVSMVPTSTAKGYWLIASDGGVFSFGDAKFFGSAAATRKAFVGATRSEGGSGYVLLAADGTRHAFGDATR